MTLLPQKVKPGSPVRAPEYNRLVTAVHALLNVRPGKGIRWKYKNGGIDLSLVERPEEMLLGIIDKVNSPNGENTAQDLAQVTYDIWIRNRPDYKKLVAVTPHYREDSTVDGEPARVGDDCFVFVRRDSGGVRRARVWAFTEKVIHFECEPPAQAATVTALQAQVAELSARLATLEGGASDV